MARHSEPATAARILILDDDPTQLETLVALVEDEGLEAVGCALGRDALERLQQEDIDVAVVDLHLPDISDVELLDELATYADRASIIINTGFSSYESASAAVNLGACAYIEKGTKPEGFIRHLHRAIQARLRHHAERLEAAVAERTRELQEANEALRDSEEKYRGVVEDTPVLICCFLPDGELTFVNRTYCTYFARRPDELVGSTFLSLLPEADREKVMESISALTVESPTHSHDHRVIAPGGDIRWQRWTIRALFDAQGTAVAYQSVGEDITERKRSEERLRLLGTVAEQVSDSIIVTDTDFRITYLNDAAVRLFGYELAELTGQTPGLLNAEPLSEQIQDEIYQTVAAGRVYAGTHRNRRKDESTFICEIKISPMKDKEGEICGYIGLQRDVTEQREVEAQLRQSQKMEAVGHLAGGVAHDFRNQLTVIQGWSYMLQEQLADDKDRRDMVGQILQATKRSATLTGQLLAFSRKEMLQPETTNVAQLVFELSKPLKRMIREDIALRVVSAGVSCCANIDTGQFQQAIINLAVNARDAMPDGGELTIETRLIELQQADVERMPGLQPEHYVEIRVNDTGTGMDEETRLRVFDPFFTTKEVGKGTGLGLSMVYGFVRQSGGFVECHSRLGEGTRFSLYFPAVRREPHETESETETAELLTGRETILIAEDQDSVRQLLVTMLNRLGYTVLEASDALEVLQIVATHESPIDLLITDVIMPGMNGVDLANRLRSAQSDLTVLYISGHTGEELLRRGVVESGGEFLAKPFNSQQLGQRVRQLLDAR